MLSNILVAIDGSKPATQALNMAVELANKFDAKLHLIHVVREMQLPPDLQKFAELEAVQGTRQDVLNTIAEQLVNQGKRVAETIGVVSVETDIGTGDPCNAYGGHLSGLNMHPRKPRHFLVCAVQSVMMIVPATVSITFAKA